VGHTGVVDEEVLAGGVANAGAVTRHGGYVMRPANEHSATIHRFLRGLRATGFEAVPRPVGVDPDGRERLTYIDGDVPLPPFPTWVKSDACVASVARLVRRFHDASQRVDTIGMSWSAEMADPEGGQVVCHNDVCLENVVFRDGQAVALLDWDFAAPGRPVYDLAQFARMCIPVDDDLGAANLGFGAADRPARLRVVADEYGLDAGGRAGLVRVLGESIANGGEFVRRRVEAGDSNFIEMWHQIGGMERFDRRRRWWHDHGRDFARVMR